MQILEYLKDLITLEPGQQPTGKLCKLKWWYSSIINKQANINLKGHFKGN